MIITDDDILEFIRKNYPGYEKYNFSGELLKEEKYFIVINDIHEVDEASLDLEKDIFVRNLVPQRQTNVGNIRLFCDALNADGSNLGDDVYDALEKYNPQYSKSYLKNSAHWTTLEAFFIALDKAKELLGSRNPRSVFEICKFMGLDKSIFDTANFKMNLVSMRLLYELFFLETRKANYDLVIQPVTTQKTNTGQGMEFETLFISKYFRNFELHQDLKFDHEFQVKGIVSGLAARKRRPFADVKVCYYCFDLLSVFGKEYAYRKLNVRQTDSANGTVLVDEKPLAHKVLLKKIKVESSFAPAARWMASLLAGKRVRLPQYKNIYDHCNPIEISSLAKSELNDLISSGEGMLVYFVDETIYDEGVQGSVASVVEKGEMYNAKYSLSKIRYVKKPIVKNILDYGYLRSSGEIKRVPLYSSAVSKRVRQIQIVKLFESLIKEKEFALAKAKQVEILNYSLEQKVEERTNALKEALTEVENEKDQKTIFFVNLAHEIKTPLTIIKNGFESFRDKLGAIDEVEEVSYNLDLLLRNMADFMDAEKLQKGIAVYDHQHTVNLTDFVKSKLLFFRTALEKKKLSLDSRIEEGAFIRADVLALDRILNNLLDNAVKYNREQGSIIVELFSQSDKVILKVADTGLGIEPEQFEKIFQPYYQLSNKKMSRQGIGMGLFIVAEIVKSLSGEMQVESQVGKGSCFKIEFSSCLPKTMEPVQENVCSSVPLHNFTDEGLTNSAACDPDKDTILLVEDNPTLLRHLKEKTQNLYNVLAAMNGLQALEILGKYPRPDLILSDIMMDEMDGQAFLAQVRKSHEWRDIPFLFLTAKTSEVENLEGLAQGALDYIYKPFSMEMLLAKIRSVLIFQRLKQIALQEDKAASLGRLASGIAHEILNPLAGISGPLEILKGKLEKGTGDKQAQEAFRYIDESITRIETIVRDLRGLIYERSNVLESVHLRSLLESLVRILDKNILSRITVSLDMDESLIVHTNRAGLSHIFLNLLNNAVDSIADRGTIVISARGEAENYTFCFTDTGVGIPRNHLAHIFERNFTTKGPGQGTGFGLYLVKELSERLGFKIEIQSEENKGTEITLIHRNYESVRGTE